MKFGNAAEFNRFVKGLDEKEIKRWKSADWVKMYQALEAALFLDGEIVKKASAYIDERVKNGEVTHKRADEIKAHANADDNEIWLAYLQKVFMNDEENVASLCYLYENYRFEAGDLRQIYQKAHEIGEVLAAQKIDLTEVNLPNPVHNMERRFLAERVDRAVYDTTNYGKYQFHPQTGEERKGYDVVKSVINVGDIGKYAGKTLRESFYASKIEFSNSACSCSFLITAVHECVHAHVQVLRGYQIYEKKGGLLPWDNMSDGFYDVLSYNHDYYLLSENSRPDLLFGEKKSVLKRPYLRQPVEKLADTAAMLAERVFRAQKGQKSETVMRYIVLMGSFNPEMVFYGKKGAVVAYKEDVLDEAERTPAAFLKVCFAKFDEVIRDKIKVLHLKTMFFVEAPTDYKVCSEIKSAARAYFKSVEQKREE